MTPKPKEPVSDLAFMRDGSRWPNIVLPVKRRGKGGMPECALLWDPDVPTLILANMWDAPEKVLDAPTKKYSTFEELVQDGWAID